MDVRTHVEQRLAEVARDVLGADVRECEGGPHVGERGAVLATVGFGGEDMHGALAVLGLEPAVRAVVAAVFATPVANDTLLSDMVAELSNLMLLGRDRAVLLREGAPVAMSRRLVPRGFELASASGEPVTPHKQAHVFFE